jgi:hypothetical protein
MWLIKVEVDASDIRSLIYIHSDTMGPEEPNCTGDSANATIIKVLAIIPKRIYLNTRRN